jgi:hypothetical protein
MECLSVLSDVLRRYPTLVQEHEKIQKAIVPHLTSTRDASRKKAISCLGYWSVSAPDNLFSDLVTYLLNEIQSAKKANYIRTLISVIGAIRYYLPLQIFILFYFISFVEGNLLCNHEQDEEKAST